MLFTKTRVVAGDEPVQVGDVVEFSCFACHERNKVRVRETFNGNAVAVHCVNCQARWQRGLRWETDPPAVITRTEG